MSDTQIINQLKFRISSLESNLLEKQKVIDQYKTVESEADSKIKAMQKIQSEKVKSLLNSIQILKKQKASIQGLSKQHKRSKLIEQLNKEIGDQDLAIQVLRKHIYDEHGKQKGRQICDDKIVKALTKGPQRIRPLTRQQLKMQIDRLKQTNFTLQKKIKQGDMRKTSHRLDNEDNVSEISSVTEESFVNQNQQIFQKIKQYQMENQNLKLDLNSKIKIIEKLKNDLKEKDKLKAQLQLIKNQIEIANRKVLTYERLMKQAKEKTNSKMIDLYERQIKVQELEMMSKENADKLKNAHQSHNMFIEQMKAQKEQLQAKYQTLKQQNDKLILDNITNKKRQDDQKNKINEIRQLNNKQKNQLGDKLSEYENQIKRVLDQNEKLQTAYRNLQNSIFKERAEYVQERLKLIEELQQIQANKSNQQVSANYMQQINTLKEQNLRLKNIVELGGGSTSGSSNDKFLLERLQNYKRKLQLYQSKTQGKDIELYNDLFKKYNQLSEQFMKYQQKYGPKQNQGKTKRKQIVQMTKKQQLQYNDFSSGVSSLNLKDVDSDILDNFDTSYEYSIHVNEDGQIIKMPKITQADKQLLKLISSDLWDFVKDDTLQKKMKEVIKPQNQSGEQDDYFFKKKLRQIHNVSHPQGYKLALYQQELNQLDNMSDNVSITSAMEKQLNNFDSDVNIQIRKVSNGNANNNLKNLNYRQMKNVSLDIGSDVDVSSVASGDSNIKKKKKAVDTQKASKIKFGSSQGSSSFVQSSFSENMLNSDVSSIGISQHQLNNMDSDVQVDFKRKKRG